MKNRIFLLTIISLIVTTFGFSQNQIVVEYDLDNQHCIQLDNALMNKDLKTLETILHPNLTLGHSNGWIETKESLLTTLPTSKIQYQQFTYHGSATITFKNDKIKSIRRNLTAFGKLNETEFQVDLKILEVWIYENDEWKLLSRQSIEVNFDS